MSDIPTYMGLGAPALILENISTVSTAVSLGRTDLGKTMVWNGNAGPARIFLPQALERGEWINILIADQAVTSATLIGPSSGNSGAQDIVITADTTGGFIQTASTEEVGLLQFLALSPNRWMLISGGTDAGGDYNTTTTGA